MFEPEPVVIESQLVERVSEFSDLLPVLRRSHGELAYNNAKIKIKTILEQLPPQYLKIARNMFVQRGIEL